MLILLVGKLNHYKHVAEYLQSRSHIVHIANNTEDGLNAVQMLHPDVIGLQTSLTGLTAVDFLQRLRLNQPTPVIALSQDVLPAATNIRLLDAGADDCTATTSPDELEARIRAILRRKAGFAESVLKVGDISLDMSALSVWVKPEAVVKLTPRRHTLLQSLMLRPERTVSRDFLLNRMVNDQDFNARLVDNHIIRLRRTLENLPSKATIETVRSEGYRLIPG